MAGVTLYLYDGPVATEKEHPTVSLWTREFRDRLLLRGWSEKKAARFARAWGQRYLKRLQQLK